MLLQGVDLLAQLTETVVARIIGDLLVQAVFVSGIESLVEFRVVGLEVHLGLLRAALRHVDDLQVLVFAYAPLGCYSAGYDIHDLLLGGFVEIDTAGHEDLHHFLLRGHESRLDVLVILLHGSLPALRLFLLGLEHARVDVVDLVLARQERLLQGDIIRSVGQTVGYVLGGIRTDLLRRRQSRQSIQRCGYRTEYLRRADVGSTLVITRAEQRL